MFNRPDFNRARGLSKALFLYVWRTSRSRQIAICLLTMLLPPLYTIPLELQRRIVDDALIQRNLNLLAALAGAYFAIVCLEGGLKYLLNMLKGTAAETIARDIRLRIVKKVRSVRHQSGKAAADLDAGTIVSMLAAETEDLSGFSGEAFGRPLLAATTILYVGAYLLWVEPAIAMLAIMIYLPQAVIVPLTQRTINRLARLRIQMVRNLGHFSIRSQTRRTAAVGSTLINRIFRLRIWIYLRKFALAALGNFLDDLGKIIVLTVGGYLVIQGRTEVSTLVVFMSGLSRIADPWDELINFYRSVSNTAVMYDMIRNRLESD
jgi:ABC-type multidrug transport system fused ATPase/permease subunit